jgi:hypothetical protein
VGRQSAAAGQLAAPLAQVGEAQDRRGEVILGGQFQRVDAGIGQCTAQRFFAPGGARCEAAAEAGIE